MTKELREIMRELDRECGIVDPALVTPPEVPSDGFWLTFEDYGIPWINERVRGTHWTDTHDSSWLG